MSKKPSRGKKPASPKPDKPQKSMQKLFENLLGPMEHWSDPDEDDMDMADFDPLADLMDLFQEEGAVIAAPDMLQPLDAFLDTAGEEIRRRLFITEGPDGEQLCLRPEFTIPVCRDYLAAGMAGEQMTFAYMGPVFRQRAGASGEFAQAGVERLGDGDRLRTDAELLALATDCIDAFLVPQAEIVIGDEGLFSAVLDALDLPAAIRRRLRAAFGDEARMTATLEALTRTDGTDLATHSGLLSALTASDPAAARAVVEDLLALAGLKTMGSRTAHEIAERFMEKAEANAAGGLSAEKAALIRRFLAIEGDPKRCVTELRKFARATGLDLTNAIADFETRHGHLVEADLSPHRVTFRARFGRNLDYYTGFVFEIFDPRRQDGEPIGGGGRYDGLLQRLGAEGPIPAAGFSIWLERLGQGVGEEGRLQ